MSILQFVLIMGAPTTVTGFFCWMLKRSIDKAEISRREATRIKNELYIIRGLRVALALGEAAAEELQLLLDECK